MHTFLRTGFVFCVLFLAAAFLLPGLRAQCVGLPTVTALGSNKFPAGLCAPVDANVTYTVAFASPVPPGNFDVVYDWGDGTAPQVVSLATGTKTYNVSLGHTYPADSDCEYSVSVVVRYKGKICTNTLQLQKISSWRTDAFNGGDVSLLSPHTKTNVHLVCEGEDISVTFNDNTNWNCNTQALLSGADPIESPNTEYRWQQIVYNTAITGSRIPNVSVDGIPITGAGGLNILPDYQDPRGVFFMSAPVLVNDARRRPSLKISSPGGFGAGFPKAGDSFAVTLRYWNFCNPYDDPEIPGPPADLINGDHPPVETTALIKVLAPPPALTGTSEAACFGTTPPPFSVSGITSGNLVNWYRDVPGSNERGQLIASTTTGSLAVTSHPDWQGNKVPGVFGVWATQRTNSAGATNCESAAVLVTRSVREQLIIPPATIPPPAEICNGQTFTVALPAPAAEAVGGPTSYSWAPSAGLAITSSTMSSATFSVGVTDFGAALYVDRTVTINRGYTSTPACSNSRTYTIRIYRSPVGGTLSGQSEVCEINSAGTITLTGQTGTITRWEIKKDNEGFTPYSGQASANSISPGGLPPGYYTFRAVLGNGPCNEVYSSEQNLHVFSDPGMAEAGDDQFICNALQSAALNAVFPESGKGLWTYISSVPAALPPPAFTEEDPHTSVQIKSENAGVYTLRWTVANGACQSYDDVIIDFGTDPTDPHAGNDKSVCGPTTTLEGNVPEKGQGSWTIVSGPNGCNGNGCSASLATPSSPASAVELSGADPVFGAYTFRWTISSGGNNCFLKADDVTVTFEAPVTVNASDVAITCVDKDNPQPISLNGSVEGPVTTVGWENVSGTGSVSASTFTSTNGTLSVSAYYQPSAADYDNGMPVDLKFVATPGSGSCVAVERIITINLERKPFAYAGENVNNICEDFAQVNATAPLSGTGQWTTTQPGVVFDNPADPKTTVRNLPVGSTHLSWTVTNANGVCISSPSSITLTRVARPDARDLTVTECEVADSGANIVLADYENDLTSLDETDREVSWYRGGTPPAGIAIASSSTVQTGVGNGQHFLARIRDTRTSCISDAKLTVMVRELPGATNAVTTLCEDVAGSNTVSDIDLSDASFVNAVTNETNVAVTWFNTEYDAMNDRFPIVEPVMVNGKKPFFAKIIYDSEPRCSAIARLDIVVNPQPAVTAIIGRESVCQGTSSSGFNTDLPVQVYQVSPIAGAKYHWQIPDDPNTEFKVFGGGGENDFYILLQFPNVFTGKIKVSAELNGCSGPVIEKEITVSASPAKPLILGPSVVCENDANIAFSVSPDNAPLSAYNWEIRKVSDNTIAGAYIMEGQLTGKVLVNFGDEDVIISVRENNAECVSPVASKVINISNPPKAELVINKEISCFMETDGVIKTKVTGGTAPFTNFEIVETGQLDPDSDGVFQQLNQGSYSVRLRDANGCMATSNVIILKQPESVTIDKITVVTDAYGYNVSCRDAQDGVITVNFSGGNTSGDYTVTLLQYNSSSPAAVLKGTATVTFSGVAAGMYSVVAEDAMGCSSLPSVVFVVSPPQLYPGTIGVDQVICSGEDPGPITELTPVQGGTGYYEYEWQESSTGNVYNDAEWTTIAGQSAPTFDPTKLTTHNSRAEKRFYRRLVKTISWLSGLPEVCEVKGQAESVSITINPLPVADFTSRSAEVCEGDAVALDLRLIKGKAPISFDYATRSTTFTDQTGPMNTVVTVANHQHDDRFSLLRLMDANGCVAETLPASVEVKVVKVNPEFFITKPDNTCNGGDYKFTWNAEVNVDYRWEWSDGTITELRSGAVMPGTNKITHTFRAKSSSHTTEYVVKLFASRAGCLEKIKAESIIISPAIALNVVASDTLLCSGEQTTFYNNSSGVDRGTWYYNVAGISPQVLLPKNSGEKHATFVFENITASNPLKYEISYEAENSSGCTEVYRQNLYVYQSNRASFEVNDVPAFDGESVNIALNNTSEVLDEEQFTYHWTYGDQGFVKTASATGPFDITYYSPGTKEIRLNIVNRAAQRAGTSCESTFRKEISIPVNKLDASFTATPFASCAPVTIEVKNATTGADTFLWSVFRSGTLVSTSNIRYPEFRITAPGTYDIQLIASNASTGQHDEAEVRGIQVLEVPHAAFELRSDVIYVPDVPMQVMNFSTGANQYQWRFGDGNTSDAFEPEHAYTADGNYQVILLAGIHHGTVDIDGDQLADERIICYDSAARSVIALNGGELHIPNAFTPDTNGPNGAGSAGFNDVFLPKGKGLTKFHMQIYDRWGTLIFESHEKDSGWDGYDRNQKLMPAGVYVFKVIVRTSKGEDVTRAGDVTLIR